MTDLWQEASRDVEAENAELVMSKAKMATADIWPFLALARSVNEFDHRLALAEDHLEAAVPHVATRDQVVASFREDFGILDSIRAEAADDDDADDNGGPSDDDEDDKPWNKKGSVQIFHQASQQWITVEADARWDDGSGTAPQFREKKPLTTEWPYDDGSGVAPQFREKKPLKREQPYDDGSGVAPQFRTYEGAAQPTPGNPYDVPVEEEGPETAQTGTYPKHPTGADPYNPIQSMFPMQPSQWKENPEVQWVDNPMSFAPYRTASAPYTNEGVQTGTGPNPDYFAGGEEGVAGSEQAGFPVDESLPEPDSRVDYYGGVPPVQSGGSSGPDGTYGKQGAKDNHGACYDCRQPVYRKGSTWLHLQNEGDHPVRLPSDHPWVQARMSARKKTARFFDPGDTSVGMAREGISSTDMGAGQGPASSGGGGSAPDAAPPPPPSMTPGGPGAQAMPPLQPQTIPNDSVSQHPFPNLPAGGGGGGGAPGMGQNPFMGGNPFMGSMYFQAETRNRPTSQDPTGVGGDEFDANTWDNVLRQNPRQSPEERRVNTPQKPDEPIPQNTSSGVPRNDEEEEEGGRR